MRPEGYIVVTQRFQRLASTRRASEVFGVQEHENVMPDIW